MKPILDTKGRLSSEELENTDSMNIVIRHDSVSVQRMHDLSIDEARRKYIEVLKNLTRASTRKK